MLPRQITAFFAVAALVAVTAPVVNAGNDCQLNPTEADPQSGYFGRPCLTIPSQDPACVPFEANPMWTQFGTICTFYVFLVPFENGEFNGAGTTIDVAILWGETNGQTGLQSSGGNADSILLV